MERPRERAIERVRNVLERAGFFVSDAHSIRPTSFDLVARRDSLLLIVKVLKNIDALDPQEAARLRELGALFPAVPIVIGTTSGAAPLEPGVVYNRYGVPILVEESLADYVEKGLPPFLFSSPGGVFARIDGERLRALREARNLSLGALASIAGVSRRTIQLYEDGAGAEVQVVERLEQYIGEPIAQAIDLFRTTFTGRGPADVPVAAPKGRPVPSSEKEEASRTEDAKGAPATRGPAKTGDAMRDGVFRQLDGMGWQVVVTVRCPFDAFTSGATRSEDEVLLTSVGTLRTAQHRAEVLQQLARVIEGHAMFVVQDAPHGYSVDGLPLVTVRELSRHRDRDELVDLINERESQ
ncbi:MAG: transcriptional regulator [Thermoplasmata archaeon]|nr:transcriptional regulator [Thermoplasmata archaeon]